MSSAEIEVRWADGPAEAQDALAVRERVFCEEQGVPRSVERDGRDQWALHLLAIESGRGKVVGTLRMLLAGSEAKIGRVAVELHWRGRGIGSRMLDSALSMAREWGCDRARLASQLHATALYERAGFTVQSAPFQEAGIAHVWMARSLGRHDAGREADAPR